MRGCTVIYVDEGKVNLEEEEEMGRYCSTYVCAKTGLCGRVTRS